MFVLEIAPFGDFVDFFHTVVEGNLVWEIRGEHEWFRSDALNGVGEGLLVAFAATKIFPLVK